MVSLGNSPNIVLKILWRGQEISKRCKHPHTNFYLAPLCSLLPSVVPVLLVLDLSGVLQCGFASCGGPFASNWYSALLNL
jgi:hypothetical protein